jgi:predicted secreted protein
VMTSAFTTAKRTRTTVMTSKIASVLAVLGLYGIENWLGETLGARPSWAPTALPRSSSS